MEEAEAALLRVLFVLAVVVVLEFEAEVDVVASAVVKAVEGIHLHETAASAVPVVDSLAVVQKLSSALPCTFAAFAAVGAVVDVGAADVAVVVLVDRN